MNHEVSKLPPLPDPSHYVYHDDAAGTEIAPPTPFYTADQVRAFGERCFAISSQRRPESLKSLRDEAQSLLSSASDHLDSLADKKISRAYEWWIGRRDTLVELIEKVDAAPTAALSADREGEAVDGMVLVRADHLSVLRGLHAEYAAWIAEYHSGGDYGDFIQKRIAASQKEPPRG